MGIDLNDGFAELNRHFGHTLVIAKYGRSIRDAHTGELVEPDPVNVALECETCGCVLLDFDRPEEENDGHEHRESERSD